MENVFYLNWTHNKKKKAHQKNEQDRKTDGRRNSRTRSKPAQLLDFQLEGGGALRTNVLRLGLPG